MRIPKFIVNIAILINAGLCIYNLIMGDPASAFMHALFGLMLSVVSIVR